jgi:hypothetical protein
MKDLTVPTGRAKQRRSFSQGCAPGYLRVSEQALRDSHHTRKHGILNLGLINELYSGGGAWIILVFSEDHSGKLRLVRAAVSSGSTTIAEMPESRR